MDKLTEIEKQAMQLDEEEEGILEAFEEGKLNKIDMNEEEIENLKIMARKRKQGAVGANVQTCGWCAKTCKLRENRMF